ncbi:MAG TPA: hypothetical protein VK878_00345 [Candidatus Deferrimicrobiaceae bacterium]|nr:hypothetical protein [Candidatus Deferrimicrobiaceae bacterium]
MATKSGVSRRLLAETRQQWPLMSLYERFEQVVAIVLSLVIAVVVALALAQQDHEVFQALFGMVMTVVLIALIALSRKFGILDTKATSATIASQVANAVVFAMSESAAPSNFRMQRSALRAAADPVR